MWAVFSICRERLVTCPDWIGVDWGTSHLRAWGMREDGTICRRAGSDQGMARLEPGDFQPALLDLVGEWLPKGTSIPVIACGMVGADGGWIHAPYRRTPCVPITPRSLVSPEESCPGLMVSVIAGVRCDGPDPDVMRGEETQIAGLLASEPGFDGVACLPGTHTKWVRICSGRIESFRTFMTGELFELLATGSLLRHSVAASGWSGDAFSAAVERGMQQPTALAGQLFGIRASALTAGLVPVEARARLSGLLIGAEIQSTRSWWENGDLVLVGSGPATDAYSEAIGHTGKSFRSAGSEDTVLAGLASAFRMAGDS